MNPTTTKASAAAVTSATANRVAQSTTTASHAPEVVDDHPQTPTEQPHPYFKVVPVTVPVAQIAVVPVTAAPAITTATTTKEQKSISKTNGASHVRCPAAASTQVVTFAAGPTWRTTSFSRFCVSLVDELASSPTASAGMLPDDASKDPELREFPAPIARFSPDYTEGRGVPIPQCS
jgi:hypothetical protein